MYYGATTIAMTDASVLSFTTPIWTMIIARVALGEAITIINFTAITIGFIGVIFVAQPATLFSVFDDSAGDESSYGEMNDNGEYPPGSVGYMITFFICIGGALCSSLVYILIKKAGSSVHYQVLVFYYGFAGSKLFFFEILFYFVINSLFVIAPISIVQLLIFQGLPVIPPDWESYFYLIAISVCACAAQTFFNKGGQMIAATKTAVYRSTDIVFVLVWQITLLHEIPSLWSLFGMFFVCLCTLMISFSKVTTVKEEPETPVYEYEMENLVSVETEGNQFCYPDSSGYPTDDNSNILENDDSHTDLSEESIENKNV